MVGAGVIVTLQNELADKVGSLVTVIMGIIFILCVLAFRRGIIGELMALRRRIFGARFKNFAARLQKDLEIARTSALDVADRHRAEVRGLQGELGNQKQRIGHLEGELAAISVSRDQLLTDLNQERGSVRDLSSRLAAVAHETEVWQQKAIEAHSELEALRKARPRKARRSPEQLALPKRGSK